MLRVKRRWLAFLAFLVLGGLGTAWHLGLGHAAPAPAPAPAPPLPVPAPVPAPSPLPLTVTVTVAAPSLYIPVGTPVTIADLTGTVMNPPPALAPDGSAVLGPTWTWTVTPLIGSGYSTTLTGPLNVNPDNLLLGATFTVPGECQVSIAATVTYTSASGLYTWEGGATAISPPFTAVQATLPSPIYVTPGTTTPVVPIVITPASAAPFVQFVTTNSSIAQAVGSASSLSVVGVSPGTTTLQATVSGLQLTTAVIDVLNIEFSPKSGPMLSEAFFKIEEPAGSGFFSANTTITFNGCFIPKGFPSIPISFTQQAPQVKFDPSRPDRLRMWVGGIIPSSYLSSVNPAVAMGLIGKVRGEVTLNNGLNSCKLHVIYEITPAGSIGKRADGVFQEVHPPEVWIAKSERQLENISPRDYLFGEITVPTNEFNTGPPTTITGCIRSFQADGTPLTDGLEVRFVLKSSSKAGHVYQTAGPILLVMNPSFEGKRKGMSYIAGAPKCGVSMRWQSP